MATNPSPKIRSSLLELDSYIMKNYTFGTQCLTAKRSRLTPVLRVAKHFIKCLKMFRPAIIKTANIINVTFNIVHVAE